MTGWSKRFSCEAREKSTSGGVLTVRCSEAIEQQRSIWVFFSSLLEVFLPLQNIALKFLGTSWSRVDAALARKIPAVNVWGPQLYLLEQHGFRRIVSTTFMMAFMFPGDADQGNVERYMRSLVRAQADIDVEPERYKHYFINEIPERFRDKVDVRRFGVGERVVPQPYTQAMFDKTKAWLHERRLFDAAPDAGVSYEQAVDG